MIDPDELAEQAIKNIKEDRNKADYLVTEILTDIQSGKTNHQSAGMVLSKHLETMQRANEQLVKLTALFKKTETNHFTGFSDSERNNVVPQNQWECAARLPVVTRLRGGADEDDVDDLDELDTELEAADEGGSIRSGNA